MIYGILLQIHPRLKIFLRSEEHTSELQSRSDLVCRLLLEKKKKNHVQPPRVQTDPEDVLSESLLRSRAPCELYVAAVLFESADCERTLRRVGDVRQSMVVP